MKHLFANNVLGSLVLPAASSDNAITVDNGAAFPSPIAGEESFFITLQSPGGGDVEICLCTARNGNILSVQRGADSTTARGWVIGDTVSMRAVAAAFRDFYDHNYPITGGDLQGRMFLPLDPTAQNEAATKNYVDARTANVFASNIEIDSVAPPDSKATSAAGMRSVIGGQLASLATATKTGVIPAINELVGMVTGGITGSVFWGVFDASAGAITWNPGFGQSGNALPAPSPANLGHYLICSVGGAVPPGGAPAGTYYPGDWLISDGATVWYHLQNGTATTIPAVGVSVSPAVQGQVNVQNALMALDTTVSAALPLAGGSMKPNATIVFSSTVKGARLDGGVSTLSVIDRFNLDAGSF